MEGQGSRTGPEHCAGHRDCSRRGVLGGALLLAGGTLVGGFTELATARKAEASAEPKVYLREDWGARPPRVVPQVLSRTPDHIVVHHTATANAVAESKERAFELSRGIQNWHMDNNGWYDTGQHFTISRGGYLMEGRNGSLSAVRDLRHVLGAHTANHNSHTLGIENEGTYTSEQPPRALMASLIESLAWLCTVYALEPATAIVGHRDYNATSCPGDELYALLPFLREEVEAHMAERIRLRFEGAPAVEPPAEHRPNHPEVPQDERIRRYEHGPALGDRDPEGEAP